MASFGCEQCLTDAFVLRLVEDSAVSLYAVVHGEDIFTAGCNSRCDRFCGDLNCLVPITNLGKLNWRGGSHYSRDIYNGLLSIPQKAFADKVVDISGVGSCPWVPASTSLKLDQLEADEPKGR